MPLPSPPPTDPRAAFGPYLVELRATLPPPLNTQDGLADAVGVTQPAVVAWEKGRSFPSTAKLFDLAKAADIDVADLLAHRLPDREPETAPS